MMLPRLHLPLWLGLLAVLTIPARAEAAPGSAGHSEQAWAARPTASGPELQASNTLKLRFNLNLTTNDAAAAKSDEIEATDTLLPASNMMAAAGLTGIKSSPGTAALARAQARLQAFQDSLDLARQRRREKDFAQAEKGFVNLLESTAPMEFKRPTLLEMGLLAQETHQWPRAQQIYSQYIVLFHDDPGVPELLLRQGLLYREMGAPVLALAKFYAVMSSALSLKLERLAYYQRLVLQAQAEIAETYYLQGQFEEATDFFSRLLKLDSPDLNRCQIHYKLVRSWSAAGHYPEAATQAELFLSRYPKAEPVAEVRFLLADALKHQGRKHEAMQQVLALLQIERPALGDANDDTWFYWQQRGANEIANQLYQEGDCIDALEIYLRLGQLNASPGWCLPAWYEAALLYERLKQPQKAGELYDRILKTQTSLGTNAPSPTLSTVLEMANWRKQRLAWQSQADTANQQFTQQFNQSKTVLPEKR